MHWHKRIEKNVILLSILTLITVSIGGIVEIVPTFTIKSTIEPVDGVRPYSPLELAGRNIYIREGCYTCHSQQIRTFRDEVERYGHYSLAAESMYDHPFQWGSKRTGPDLARVGGKYSNDWHVAHLKNPREVVPESIMPPYAFLQDTTLGMDDPAAHLPQFGGFCAYAVALGRKFDGDPQFADIVDGRLYLFVNAAVFAEYRKDPQKWINQAHDKWPGIRNTPVADL